jgi:MerR family transcriptional regulator, mercuric resistance operon regulatory protein
MQAHGSNEGAIMTSKAIGEVSQVSRVNIETIRYYERIGLLLRPARTSARHRRFNAMDLQRLVFIKRARELGFSIDEIRTLLELSVDRKRSCSGVKEVVDAHLKDIRLKLRDLKRIERVLADLVVRCIDKEATSCPALDAISSAPS